MRFTSPHSTSLFSVHFTSLYCTSLPSTFDNFSLHFRLFTSLVSASLHFSMTSSTLYFLLIQLNYHFPYPLFKSNERLIKDWIKLRIQRKWKGSPNIFLVLSPLVWPLSLLIVAVDSYCCVWSLSVTHTHTHTPTHRVGRVINPSHTSVLDVTQHPQETHIHSPGTIRTRNPSKRAAARIDPNVIHKPNFLLHSFHTFVTIFVITLL